MPLAAAAIDIDEPQQHVGGQPVQEPREIRYWLAAVKSLGITRSNVAAASGTQRSDAPAELRVGVAGGGAQRRPSRSARNALRIAEAALGR